MNYNNIEKIRIERKIAKMAFYDQIGMSHTGFKQAIENNSLRVSTLQKIAEVLNVPVSVFFDSDNAKNGGTGQLDLLESPEPWDAESTEEMMNQYKELGLPKDDIINLLRQQLSAMKLELDMNREVVKMLQQKLDEKETKQG